MRRDQAHRLRLDGAWILLVAVVGVACLGPPDGTTKPRPSNYPPEIRLDTVRPREAVVEVSIEPCPQFAVSIGEVRDRDDDDLVVRFVADNGVPNRVRLLEEDYLLAAGTGRRIREQFRPIDFGSPLVGIPHVLSLFVTDANEFAVAATSTTAVDFGRVASEPSDADGIPLQSVIEHRWTFHFLDSGSLCPHD